MTTSTPLPEDIKQITAAHLALACLGFLSTVGPGMLLLFHFKPEIFQKTETIKLIIISAAMFLPLLVLSHVCLRIVTSTDFRRAFIFASLITACASFAALSLTYFRAYSFTKYSIALAAWILALTVVGYIVISRHRS